MKKFVYCISQLLAALCTTAMALAAAELYKTSQIYNFCKFICFYDYYELFDYLFHFFCFLRPLVVGLT